MIDAVQPPDFVNPPAILPGRTALWWDRLQSRSGLGGLAGLAGMVIGSRLDLPLRVIVVFASLGVVIVMAIAYGYASFRWSQTTRRELAAGYTTLRSSRYRWWWLLDPNTGAPVRPPEAWPKTEARDRR